MRKDKLKAENQAAAVIRRLSSNPAAMAGLIVFLLLVVIAVIAPLIAPYDVEEMDLTRKFATPSFAHPFGCDELGYDIFSRILVGAR